GELGREALYHRCENELFDELLAHLNSRDHLKVVLVPRTDAQRDEFAQRKLANIIILSRALDGANLIAAADLVISAGGTMNREAAALGVPAISVYAGEWAAIDDALMREGRLKRIKSRDEIQGLKVARKSGLNVRRAKGVKDEVVGLILD